VSSGPWGIVVVRASWPGHPTLIKKKKKKSNGIMEKIKRQNKRQNPLKLNTFDLIKKITANISCRVCELLSILCCLAAPEAETPF